MADLRIVDMLGHGNTGLLGRVFGAHLHAYTRNIFVISRCFVLPLQPHISVCVLFSHLLPLQTSPEPEEGIL